MAISGGGRQGRGKWRLPMPGDVTREARELQARLWRALKKLAKEAKTPNPATPSPDLPPAA